jgi:serine/threonine-protein kinase
MKLCPQCHRCFEDSHNYCADDRADLVISRPGVCLIDEKYHLDRLLAQGGMGAVYAATQISLDRPAAMKLLLPSLILNPEALERFRREAKTAARVSHPNLAEIYDFGSLPEGGAFIAMEFVNGQTLQDHMKELGKLSFEEAVSIARQIAEGIEAAHAAGVVHRDLKPSNIILAPNTQTTGTWLVKLVDFGIAKFMDDESSAEKTLTATGTMVGTPRYMSPEQCLGNPVDARSDIYSLGIILYEMLAGQPPFDAPSGTVIALKHTQDPPPAIEYFRPDIPALLAHLIMQMLQKDPDYRIQTAGDLASNLRAIEDDLAREVDRPIIINLKPPETASGRISQNPAPDVKHLPPIIDANAPTVVTPDLRSNEIDDLATRTTPSIAPSVDETEVMAPRTQIIDIQTGRQNRRTWLIAIVIGAVLGLGAAILILTNGGDFMKFLTARAFENKGQPTAASSAMAQPTVTQARQDAPSKDSLTESTNQKEDLAALRAALADWIAATNSGDLEGQMKYYAPIVATFYLNRNVNRDDVRAEKARLVADPNLIAVRAGEPEIDFNLDGRQAVMRFRKTFSFKGPEPRRGEVLQELRWRKTQQEWRIVGERDLRVIR